MSFTRFGDRVRGAAMGSIAVLFLCAAAQPALAQQPAPGATPAVTFARDVAPILQKNCQECHRPGAVGPMSLRTYEEVRPWVRAIKQRVVDREMPPYRYDKVGIQHLKGDLRLTEADIQTIARWVDSGSPLGNAADMPAPMQFPDGSKWAYEDVFGPPDLIVPTKPYTLPAKGQDRWWRPIVPVGSTVDRCIKALAVKPSLKGRAAAHHANSDLMVPDPKTGEYAVLERVSEYASGKVGEIVPPDGCRTLPANAMVKWDVHYWPYGEEVKDDVVELGIWLYPDDHKAKAKYKQDLKLYSLLMKGKELEIPPHGTAMTQGFHSFKTPVRIDSFQPHGHARLVGMTAEIFYPETGKLEMVSSVSNWTNQWHTSHVYEDDYAPLVPKGAVLVLTGYYDNTAKNKGNPDPDQWVGGGSRTSDEMSHAWITVTHLDDEGYKQVVADRESRLKAKKTTNNDQQ
jgi:mono/diheme cytochrome c family protein